MDLSTSDPSCVPHACLCLHWGCSSLFMPLLVALRGHTSLHELQPYDRRRWSAWAVLHGPLEPHWCCNSWRWTPYWELPRGLGVQHWDLQKHHCNWGEWKANSLLIQDLNLLNIYIFTCISTFSNSMQLRHVEELSCCTTVSSGDIWDRTKQSDSREMDSCSAGIFWASLHTQPGFVILEPEGWAARAVTWPKVMWLDKGMSHVTKLQVSCCLNRNWAPDRKSAVDLQDSGGWPVYDCGPWRKDALGSLKYNNIKNLNAVHRQLNKGIYSLKDNDCLLHQATTCAFIVTIRLKAQ